MKIVHVVGTGTIGEPLIGLLADHRERFGIDEVTFHKRTPLVTEKAKVADLERLAERIATEGPGLCPHTAAELARAAPPRG